MMGEPSEDNGYCTDHVQRMLVSLRHWTGRNLVGAELPPKAQACELFHAPYVVLSHDGRADPMLNYANRAGLNLFDLSWEELITLPSRRTAEPMHRAERELLLGQVMRAGFIDDYRGIRISKNGRRFLIEQATVWNLIDEMGAPCGQAATFGHWTFLG